MDGSNDERDQVLLGLGMGKAEAISMLIDAERDASKIHGSGAEFVKGLLHQYILVHPLPRHLDQMLYVLPRILLTAPCFVHEALD